MPEKPQTEQILEQIGKDELAADQVRIFGPTEERAVVAYLFTDSPSFPLKHLKPELFNEPLAQYLIIKLTAWVKEFGTIPTKEIFWDHLAAQLTESDPHEKIQELLFYEINSRDFNFIQKKLNDWIKHAMIGQVFDQQDRFDTGDYTFIKEIQDELTDFQAAADPCGFMSLDELMTHENTSEWLIEGILESNKPMLIAGPKKCCKTALLCDLAASLATGTPFLNKFPTPTPKRVAFFSGESGADDIKTRLKCILESKHVTHEQQTLANSNLIISFQRPKLSDEQNLLTLAKNVKDREVDVLIIDPLYLTLLRGNKDANAASLFDMGGVFSDIADSLLGVTIILCHHAKKTATDRFDLDSMAFTGAAEFCRQWILLDRRGKYTGPTNHQLEFQAGGFGHGEHYRMFLNEGENKDHWTTSVERVSVAERSTTNAKTMANTSKLRNYLTDNPSENTKSDFKVEFGWNSVVMRNTIEQAIEDGYIEEYQDKGRIRYRRIQ